MIGSIRLLGQWMATMAVAVVVGIGLVIIWGIAASAVAIEDWKK